MNLNLSVCSLLEQVEETLPDILMIDWELSCICITNLMSALLEKYPHMVVIAMSGRVEAKQEAFKAGAHAFVNKGAPPESLLETLHAVADKPGDERN